MYCASNKTAKIKIKKNTYSLRIFVREERRLYAGWVEVGKQRQCSSSRSSEIRRKVTEAGFPRVEEVTGFNRDQRCAGRGWVGLTSSAAELPTPSFPIGHLGRAPPSPRLSSTTSASSTFLHLATFASAVHFCTFPYQLAFLLNIFLHDLLTKLYRFSVLIEWHTSTLEWCHALRGKLNVKLVWARCVIWGMAAPVPTWSNGICSIMGGMLASEEISWYFSSN